MIFAVALVAMVSSWLNKVEVNAATILDFLKANPAADTEANPDDAVSAQEALLIFGDTVPLSIEPGDFVTDEKSPAVAIDDYLSELTETRAELQKAKALLADIQTEITLLKSAVGDTPDTNGVDLESDSEDADGKDDGAKADEGAPITTSGIPAPSQTAASENDSSGTAGLSDAQIWQQQFTAYQQWAQQYMVEEDSE